MECKEIEELLSEYLEGELPPEVQKEVELHLAKCLSCELLKNQMEELLDACTDLEEEIPFFLQNRLYYIPESQDNIIEMETQRYYMKWIAAVIGTFLLFLNLFYFTNIYPPANKILHSVASELKILAVKTEAIFEKVKESKNVIFPADESDTKTEDAVAVDVDLSGFAGETGVEATRGKGEAPSQKAPGEMNNGDGERSADEHKKPAQKKGTTENKEKKQTETKTNEPGQKQRIEQDAGKENPQGNRLEHSRKIRDA